MLANLFQQGRADRVHRDLDKLGDHVVAVHILGQLFRARRDALHDGSQHVFLPASFDQRLHGSRSLLRHRCRDEHAACRRDLRVILLPLRLRSGVSARPWPPRRVAGRGSFRTYARACSPDRRPACRRASPPSTLPSFPAPSADAGIAPGCSTAGSARPTSSVRTARSATAWGSPRFLVSTCEAAAAFVGWRTWTWMRRPRLAGSASEKMGQKASWKRPGSAWTKESIAVTAAVAAAVAAAAVGVEVERTGGLSIAVAVVVVVVAAVAAAVAAVAWEPPSSAAVAAVAAAAAAGRERSGWAGQQPWGPRTPAGRRTPASADRRAAAADRTPRRSGRGCERARGRSPRRRSRSGRARRACRYGQRGRGTAGRWGRSERRRAEQRAQRSNRSRGKSKRRTGGRSEKEVGQIQEAPRENGDHRRKRYIRICCCLGRGRSVAPVVG